MRINGLMNRVRVLQHLTGVDRRLLAAVPRDLCNTFINITAQSYWALRRNYDAEPAELIIQGALCYEF